VLVCRGRVRGRGRGRGRACLCCFRNMKKTVAMNGALWLERVCPASPCKLEDLPTFEDTASASVVSAALEHLY